MMSGTIRNRAEGLPARERGVVLIAVLWLLLLLTIIAAAQSKAARLETRFTALEVQRASARALAEAGVWNALQKLTNPGAGLPGALHLGDGSAQVLIEHEMGKIDLNVAPLEIFVGLLQQTIQDPEEAQHLAEAVLDWRDRDDLLHANGAEDAEYAAAGFPYGAKDGPFNSIQELRLVLGMTDVIYQTISPSLTVYSHQPGIDPDLASGPTLLAVSGRTDWDPKGFQANQQVGGALATGLPIPPRFLIQSEDQVLTLKSEGRVGTSLVRLLVVVQLQRNNTPPYAILSWREAVADPPSEVPQ